MTPFSIIGVTAQLFGALLIGWAAHREPFDRLAVFWPFFSL